MVSIVIDVERIGDYTKNIAGLASMHKKRLVGGQFEKELKRIEDAIEQNFSLVINVLKSQDKKDGRGILQSEDDTAKLSDSIVKKLVSGSVKALSTSDAVALAMYARYLKRINAHLTNIASAIVNPFPRIGFREKKK